MCPPIHRIAGIMIAQAYLEWLKARIAEVEATGDFSLIDPMEIKRAWAEQVDA